MWKGGAGRPICNCSINKLVNIFGIAHFSMFRLAHSLNKGTIILSSHVINPSLEIEFTESDDLGVFKYGKNRLAQIFEKHRAGTLEFDRYRVIEKEYTYDSSPFQYLRVLHESYKITLLTSCCLVLFSYLLRIPLYSSA